MPHLLAFFTALVISVSLIPPMIRLAPRLGLVDQPDPRKVHRAPMPRVGGLGIVVGSLLPLALWTPLDAEITAYLFGGVTLLAFGLWDDARDLGPYAKLLGQLLAVAPAVFYADVYVAQLPLPGIEALPAWFGRLFTVVALVGVINALNTSDGLDGLAGGLSLLTFAAIAYLAYESNDLAVVTVAAASAGGVVGFLRYNTYPAGTFMGDSGSQFLGFSLGFLVVLLTQDVDCVFSPALPALLLGLPVADLLYVMTQRLARGVSPLRADKNHVHHRLLDVGFDHYEAVVIIYAIHTLFVLAAVALRFESDALILALYLAVCGALFASLLAARRSGWRAHGAGDVSRLSALVQTLRERGLVTAVPVHAVAFGLPALLLAVSLYTDSVPRDLGVGAALLAAPLLVYLLRSGNGGLVAPRIAAYVTSAFVVYLETRHTGAGTAWFSVVEVAYYTLLAAAVALAARFRATRDFQPNPMDFLVIVVVVGLGVLSRGEAGSANLGVMAVKLVILFYGCELILAHGRTRWNPLNVATLVALSVLGVRAFL